MQEGPRPCYGSRMSTNYTESDILTLARCLFDADKDVGIVEGKWLDLGELDIANYVFRVEVLLDRADKIELRNRGTERLCAHCGCTMFVGAGQGVSRNRQVKYCGPRCRLAAHRARKKGIAHA